MEGQSAAPSAGSELGSSRGRVLIDDKRLGVDDRVGRDDKDLASAGDDEVAHGGVGLEDDDVADWEQRQQGISPRTDTPTNVEKCSRVSAVQASWQVETVASSMVLCRRAGESKDQDRSCRMK